MYRIIVALDGSELSERAIGLGQELTHAFSGTLELVHVMEEAPLMDLFPTVIGPDRHAAESYLRDVAAQLEPGVPCAKVVLRGSPTAQLLKFTQDEPETMLVMTTHGRGGLGRLTNGSVSDKVLRGASVPVTLLRASTRLPEAGFTNVVVPLDGSPLAEEVLPLATALARRTGATLTLVRVIDAMLQPPYIAYAADTAYFSDAQLAQIEAQLQEDARHYLSTMAAQLQADGCRVTWEVRNGKPAAEIVRVAETTAADLVLMATHGRGGFRRLVLGSVTEEVLHHGVVPVMVVPPRLQQHQHDATPMFAQTDSVHAHSQ